MCQILPCVIFLFSTFDDQLECFDKYEGEYATIEVQQILVSIETLRQNKNNSSIANADKRSYGVPRWSPGYWIWANKYLVGRACQRVSSAWAWV